MEIYERISELRGCLGLTRERFEGLTQVSRNTLRAIETKGVTPGSDVLVKISKVWPCYALWLLTGEDAPLAGQLSPVRRDESLNNESMAYQIVDVIDRDLDRTIVKSSEIEEIIFLQTGGFPISSKVERLINESIYQRKNLVTSSDNFGTAILLIAGKNSAGFKRAVLVKDGSFDLREIEQKDGIYGLLGDIKRWCDTNGIRRFQVAGVNHLALAVLEHSSSELKLEDIHPASESVSRSFKMWQEAFSFD